MPAPSWGTIKSFIIPGGMLLLLVAVGAHSGWINLTLPALSFLYYCGLVGGMLLAWRFHSSRIFFALLVLFLVRQAFEAFPGSIIAGRVSSAGLEIAVILLPLNFIFISFMQECGFSFSNLAPVFLFIFAQAVVVTVLCIGVSLPAAHTHAHHLPVTIALPPSVLLVFCAAAILLVVRAFLTRKPVESALFWSLAALVLSLRYVEITRISSLYSACAACILAASIVENSYLLAYHDELTGLPSRRAFNDALRHLTHPYSIAAVDIDHFKRFNDTYGHDIGDQVLRLVATNLARVTGGGRAFRCGGEEFTILFPGKMTSEVADHLEQLRSKIECAEFRMRGADRRHTPRGPDRRNQRIRGRVSKGHKIRQLSHDTPVASLSVTVSIGAADSAQESTNPEAVLGAADKALYRAKSNGRNRLEVSPSSRQRSKTKKAGIA